MKELLTPAELARYSRHLNLPEFDVSHQKALLNASVLVVGAGGLGSPVILYLAAAGVGTLGIIDYDVVEESNLQRQILFETAQVGQSKAQLAADRAKALNPNIQITVYEEMLTSANALEIIPSYDVVADGTDNFATRYLVNDACVLAGKPNVYASIFRFEGQASVFNYLQADGYRGPNYRDLFPSPPPPGMVPSCAEGGVLGVLPGIMGSIQASEVLKVITGVGKPLSGRLLLMDTYDFSVRFLNVKRRADNPLTGDNPSITELIDYDAFCGLNDPSEVPAIQVRELQEYIQNGLDFQLIDVRNAYEKEIADIGGQLLPKDEIREWSDQVSNDQKTIVYCRSGKRSEAVVKQLIQEFGKNEVYNLAGGILAWQEQIDPSLNTY